MAKKTRRRWYHILMKLFRAPVGLMIAVAAVGIAGVNPQLHQVKRLYILAMGGGMDQYLAQQFTNAGLFDVVTDPKLADAILTDGIGEGFQAKLDQLYPPPAKEQPKVETAKADDDPDAKPVRKNAFEGVDFSGGSVHSNTFGRGKGNFFVVDRNSRVVLWSVYERPKDYSTGELTKIAARIVKHLKDDLTDKKPAE
jgi:hypothetical protein